MKAENDRNRLAAVIKRDRYFTVYFVLIAVIWAAYVFQKYSVFLNDDMRLFHLDTPNHLRYVYDSFLQLENGRPVDFLLKPATFTYPPLIYWLSSIIMAVAGVSEASVFIIQPLFLLCLVMSVFMAGTLLAGAEAGFLCGCSLLASRGIDMISGDYMLDIPLTAFSAFALLCLLMSDGFEKRNWTIAAFIAAGLAMMTRTMAVFTVFIPFLYIFVGLLIDRFRKMSDNNKAGSALMLVLTPVSSVAALLISQGMLGRVDFLDYKGEQNPAFRFFVSIIPFFVLMIFNLKSKKVDGKVKDVVRDYLLLQLIIWPFYGMFLRQATQASMAVTGYTLMSRHLFKSVELFKAGAGGALFIYFIVGLLVYASFKNRSKELNLCVFSAVGGLVALYREPFGRGFPLDEKYRLREK